MRPTGARRHPGAETISEVTDSSIPASRHEGIQLAPDRVGPIGAHLQHVPTICEAL
jgi:hypothetical protein